jgi:hypothetical protein
MTNILFLDFDGVLNSYVLFKKRKGIETHPATPTEKKHIKEILILEREGVLSDSPLKRAKICVLKDIRSIDPEGVRILNDLLARSGAKVVVSSTWRKFYSAKALQCILNLAGFTGEVIGKTPQDLPRIHTGPYATSSPLRGHEIQHWLDHNAEGPVNLAILDDDSDMAHLSHRHVKTDLAVGLTQENAEQALRLFGV